MTVEDRLAVEAEARRLRGIGEPHHALTPGLCLRCGGRFRVGAFIRQFAQGWACCEGDAR